MSEATQSAVYEAVSHVEDPEVPVTLVDLGVVREVSLDGGAVRVVLRPTRLACPARGEMERRVRAAVSSVDEDLAVDVEWEMAQWRGDDVTAPGQQVLLQIGYADPVAESDACPYCGSAEVRQDGRFGGAVCKQPYTCRSCGSTFDVLRGSMSTGLGAHHVR